MKIYSSNEWDPLKEVIVGRVFDTMSIENDLSFRLFFKDNLYGWLQDSRQLIEIKQQHINELNEDLVGFVNVLEANGVTVYRPTHISEPPVYIVDEKEFQGSPALNVRDQCIIIDDTIVETAPCQRSRYYENDQLSHLFNDINGHHLTMPKSAMRDENFDTELIEYKRSVSKELTTNYGDSAFFKDEEFVINVPTEIEMMIDGANCVRFNDNIIINIANRNQYLGLLWFKKNFPKKNWHPIYSLCDNHLDSFIVPLCEGTLLLRNNAFFAQIPKFLKDWKIIYPPKTTPQFPTYTANDTMLTSTYIDMNVLSIDGNKIICNTLYPELGELLYKEGFDPIPVQHRHRRIFAGGFHCFTLDLLREHN